MFERITEQKFGAFPWLINYVYHVILKNLIRFQMIYIREYARKLYFR